jgi:hypothetical protein
MPRTATIGPAVYQRVNELVTEGKTRTEAFAQVGQERDQQPGTVSANYYRVARSMGRTETTRRRRRRATTAQAASPARRGTRSGRAGRRPAATASTGTGGDLNALASQIADLTQQLVRQIEKRDAEIRRILG